MRVSSLTAMVLVSLGLSSSCTSSAMDPPAIEGSGDALTLARAGADVFTLVDTRTWYVVANFRETQLRHIPAGASVDVYLQSQPSRHFRGTVVGLGWAVLPENGTSVNGLPRVERSLDWIRLAARFPIRIKVDNPDDSFRIGASAVATVSGTWRSVDR